MPEQHELWDQPPRLHVPDAGGPHLAEDICSGKHRGNESSVAAYAKARRTKGQEQSRIREWLATVGCGTAKEYMRWANSQDGLQRGLNCLSGRFSEMKEAGVIEETGQRREGCAEVRLKASSTLGRREAGRGAAGV